jgi:hypothetical protein
LRELVVGNGADPVLRGVQRISWDGADGAWIGEAAADGDVADGVVADATFVVSVDEILCGPSEIREGGDEARGVGGRIDGKEGWVDVGGIVDGPTEREGSLFSREDAGDDGRDDSAVFCGRNIQNDIFVAFDVDDLTVVEEGMPGAVLRFVLSCGAGAVSVFDVDVLNGGSKVGEAPGDVVVVACDDEGQTRKRDSSDVEIACGGRGLEVGLVPDAGDTVGEVLVVGEEWFSSGGVGSGDDPVV